MGIALRSGLAADTRSNVRWIRLSLLLAVWWCPRVHVTLSVAAEIFRGYGVFSDTPGEALGVVRPLNSPGNGVIPVSGDYCHSIGDRLVIHDC